ncbi:elongin-B isoform X1 [Neoarius graeffei]|uniref:elongin-B isoform X1 n=2 Tax=Neoarius graeffei TaxID=443677 RepID=UPI00298D2B95|nr:elongin-B isoform X1 [Neoarius graeffei]
MRGENQGFWRASHLKSDSGSRCDCVCLSNIPSGMPDSGEWSLRVVMFTDVFLMIRRHKTTIFTDAKESTTVYELKRIVEGILKRAPEEQRLYKDDMLLEDSKTLGDCGFTNQTARPQAPATVGLAFRISDDAFEPLRVDAFSSPPELPDVMKPQDSGSTANEQAVQ